MGVSGAASVIRSSGGQARCRACVPVFVPVTDDLIADGAETVLLEITPDDRAPAADMIDTGGEVESMRRH